ncbi:valine--pyruvate transaminase, partial [Salmonella enterica subsp. enterica serovar Weltevreden]|nr:valine--pyruvate transaminase [Salmonella enterica subsp. enterica serovar Weltevreden]
MPFSRFGDNITRHSRMTRLMEDLTDGLRPPGAILLGGGNQANIAAMQDYLPTLLTDLVDRCIAADELCNYDGP